MLSHKIPLANNTRWNSHYCLHVHLVSHMEGINQALIKVNHTDLVFTDTQKNILTLASNAMEYFSEATNILQREDLPTLNCDSCGRHTSKCS